MIVAPSGAILAEAAIDAEATALAQLQLRDVSNWVLSQARDDVVVVTVLDLSAPADPLKLGSLSKHLDRPALTGRPPLQRISLSDREMVSVLDAPFGCL